MYDWFFNRYYPSRSQTRSELGSGVIIDKRGYVFTNYHVVQNAERLQVTTVQRQELRGQTGGHVRPATTSHSSSSTATISRPRRSAIPTTS